LYSFDASAMVDLWDNYPIQNPHFKSIWDWFEMQVKQEVFSISAVALKQVRHKIEHNSLEEDIPESILFIQALNHITTHKVTTDDLKVVQYIKTLLDIQEDDYAKGVDEKDLLIIANAKNNNITLVTTEKRQNNLSSKKANYHMPAVCNLTEIAVTNINLAELLHTRNLWQ
jgi:predicted nucleic acid-binding protein